MKRGLSLILLALIVRSTIWGPALLLAQVNSGAAPYTFVAGTTISSTEVNANFSRIYSDALDRTGGSMTGDLTSRHITPAADNTYDLGSSGMRWRNIYVVGSVGSVGGALSAISTTPPQLSVGYDGSNKLEVSVGSTGAVTMNASGAGQGFTFSDNVTGSGTLTVQGGVIGNGTGSFADTLTLSKGSGTALSLTSANASIGGTLSVTGTSTLSGVATASTGLTVTTGGVTVSAGGLTLSAGPLKLAYTEFATTPYTATTSHVWLINKTVGAAELDLYACGGTQVGYTLYIHNDSASTLTVDPNGSETIDNSSTKSVTTGTGIMIVCDGVDEWHALPT